MSKRLLRLGFDIDGVLANFVKGFLGLVNRECGTAFVESDWIEYGPTGGHPAFLTKQQWDTGWAALKKEPYFWANLEPTTSLLSKLSKSMIDMEYAGYFFTRRTDLDTLTPGDASLLTRLWLGMHQVREYSALIAVKNVPRLDMLKACEIDAYIDDWGEQFQELVAGGVNAYLIDRPYNQQIETDRRVFSLDEFVDRALNRTPQPAPKAYIEVPLLAH